MMRSNRSAPGERSKASDGTTVGSHQVWRTIALAWLFWLYFVRQSATPNTCAIVLDVQGAASALEAALLCVDVICVKTNGSVFQVSFPTELARLTIDCYDNCGNEERPPSHQAASSTTR